MGREVSDIRITDSGTLVEIRTTKGEVVGLPVKRLLPLGLRPVPSAMPPDWRLLDARLSDGSVRFSCANGLEWERPSKYVAETAGLVPLDQEDPAADLLVLGADWALVRADGKSRGKADWDLREDLGVAIRSGRILALGPGSEIQARYNRSAESGRAGPRILDAGGLGITPGLIDPHTHLIFAGDRSREFAMRAAGATYLEIAAAGGGIRSTMAATRAASDEQLLGLAEERLSRIASWGVTTLEAKSGYALDLEGELRILRLLERLHRLGALDIQATVLSAHVVPPEYKERRDEYVRLVMDDILPLVVKEGLASSCDVFCEEGAFTLEETRAILEKAKALGLGIRVHAEQFTDSGGAALAAELGAWSADHLEAATDETIGALAGSGTVAVLLPGAALTVGESFPDARKLLDSGVTVALGTDFNPGTSMTESLPLMMSLACTRMGMTLPEAWAAVTKNAAKALGLADRGTLEPGALADMALFAAPGPESIPYQLGRNLSAGLVKAGRPLAFP